MYLFIILKIFLPSSTVRVGEYNLSSEIDCDKDEYCAPAPQDFVPINTTIHPDYNKPGR